MRNSIHKVIFKDNELYIKGYRIDFAADGLSVSVGGELSSCTYFGAMSVGKWKRYTTIDSLGLCVRAKGVFALKVWHTDGECIINQNVENADFGDICVSIPMYEKGLVYFTISEVAEETHIEDVYYYIDSEPVDKVKLAINICTYNREEYLTRNLSELKSAFLSDAASAYDSGKNVPKMSDDNTGGPASNTDCSPGDAERVDLEVFISDNASKIPTDRFVDNRIHVVHNKNLGGAGGFTRGLCEILKYNDSCGGNAQATDSARCRFTHVLFMDDDVTIEPESIRRTYMLLSYLRDEYADAFISGAMLREEKPYIQHENGALWNAGKCKFVGRGVDMRDEASLVLNETDYDRDYAAWWYCCMPMSAISYDNLPIPIFVHEDDAEYSLRNASNIITLNGICVWHPASPHRRQSVNEYYNLRNMLIVNSKYCKDYRVSKATGRVITMLLVALMRHRYRDMKLIRKAVIDYLAGPDYLMSVDQTELHQTITGMGYEFEDVSSELDGSAGNAQSGAEQSNLSESQLLKEQTSSKGNGTSCVKKTSDVTHNFDQRGFKALWVEADSVLKRLALIGRLVSFNGWLLPRKRYTEVHYMNEHPVNLYRTGRLVLYDDADNKGIIADKEFFRIFEMLGYSLELWIRLLFGYRRAARLYNEKWNAMTSIKYWKKAFELNDVWNKDSK